jgi:hypothetical protein
MKYIWESVISELRQKRRFERHFRSALNNGHRQQGSVGPVCANMQHRRLGLIYERGRPTLLVKLGYNAKAEKRLTSFVYNFHPPFRTSFNWIV